MLNFVDLLVENGFDDNSIKDCKCLYYSIRQIPNNNIHISSSVFNCSDIDSKIFSLIKEYGISSLNKLLENEPKFFERLLR